LYNIKSKESIINKWNRLSFLLVDCRRIKSIDKGWYRTAKNDLDDDFEEDDDEREYYEVADEWLSKADKNQLDEFKKWFENSRYYGDSSVDGPPHSVMEFVNYVKPAWLVHFTNDASSISLNGFLYGHEEMTSGLALTTPKKNGEKTPGYNFAFEEGTRDAKNAANDGKYGNEAVVFWSDGVNTYHNSDEENQIIFWGSSVDTRMIFPISKGEDNDWVVYNPKSGNPMVEGDFSKITTWVIDNYRMLQHLLGKNKISHKKSNKSGMSRFSTNIDSPEFKSWFGNSKVVEKDGSPLVVYHGTDNSFDLSNFKMPAFFTNSPGESSMYSIGSLDSQNSWTGPRIEYNPSIHNLSEYDIRKNNESCSIDIEDRIVEQYPNDVRNIIYNDGVDLFQISNPDEYYTSKGTIDPELALISGAVIEWEFDGSPIKVVPYDKEQTARTIPVYLRIENPYYMKAKEASRLENFSDNALQTVEELKKRGYDGIITESDFSLSDNYLVFSKDQIRSSISFLDKNKARK
jgi:hypothetical protein